jgi:V8-like Glu-specific endopeptidase
LGTRSFITIRSLKDGAEQRLDATSIKRWRNHSAFFNGEAVEVQLHVSAGDQDVFFEISEVFVGERGVGEPPVSGVSERASDADTEAVCGTDNRVASADAAVGRIVPVGCTGWIVSNGVHLTAGHCAGPDMETLEFNIPASNADGTINHPRPENQFPINQESITFANDGVGADWTVFDVDANDTGLRPVESQKAFYRMSRDSVAGTFRITGYGLDGPADCFGDLIQSGCSPPPPPTPLRNADSQTQQTDAGGNRGEVGSGARVSFRYEVDTQRGNSGSPIVEDGRRVAVGIHTNGGCSADGGTNAGTSFENDDLEEAIQTLPGQNIVYVDKAHPAKTKSGTVLRPFEYLGDTLGAVPTGGTISIVAGSYRGPTTLSRAMTLTAPVGAVTITAPGSTPPASCPSGQRCCEPLGTGCSLCVPQNASCP